MNTTAENTATYRTLARRRWPRAAWIAGSGEYATVSHCRPRVTVELHRTHAKAEESLAAIDTYGCGSRCDRRHRIVTLTDAERAVQTVEESP